MSSYFSLPSFARAKQNQENLEKTNPQNPVLKDGDEHFLNQQIESDKSAPEGKDAPATMITEEGEEKEVPQESQEQTAAGADQVVVPEEKPVPAGGAQDSKGDTAQDGSVEDPPEQAPEDSTEKVEASATKEKKNKKNKSFDLPSQEDAEAATRGFNVGAAETGEKANERTQGEKRTWASYLPSMSSGAKKEQTGEEKPADEHTKADPKDQSTTQGPNPESEEATKGESKGGDGEESAEKRTWVQYASSAYSSLPSMPSLPTRKSKDTDSKAEPVYNEDGTINEEETKKKQEQEVSVLLDNLNMSSINNRVFAFSGETQKIYERFAQVLKDTMEGGPTAYEDMDKLMKDAGPQLEKQFQAMPPFVQTLVKSLPSKLGTTLGPELLAAASEKPGNDMKARMQAANKTSASASGGTGDASIKTAETGGEEAQKKKRRIPGLKGLVSQQGTVASILRNVVTFLRVRFPFLASTTNVVMSLAVFILMFVFWYCHKRGKEARLLREGASGKVAEVAEEDEGNTEVEVTDEEEVDDEGEDEDVAEKEPESVTEQEDSAEAVSEEAEQSTAKQTKPVGVHNGSAEAVSSKAPETESLVEQEDSAEAVSGTSENNKTSAVLDQAEPSDVPLPHPEKGEKGAELEAAKAVGA